MIHSTFGKNKPANFIIVIAVIISFFICYEGLIHHFSNLHWHDFANLILVTITLLMVDFINKSNYLSDNNSYAIYFFSTTFCFFPYFLEDLNLITANLLVSIAMYRLTTLWKKSAIKQKIFDSSLLIVVASLFYNWAILFLLIVWISVILYSPKSPKNIFIPLVAIITVALNVYLYSILSGNPLIIKQLLNFKIVSIHLVHQPLSFWIPVGIILIFSLFSLAIYHYKKKEKVGKHRIPELLSYFFFVSLIIVVFAKDKTNSEGIFTLLPFSFLMTLLIEKVRKPKIRNGILYLFALLPFGLLLLHFIAKS